jgi:hypothetical protein
VTAGHALPVFMVSVALSGTLSYLTGAEGGGGHALGPSSIGKSAMPAAGVFVWGRCAGLCPRGFPRAARDRRNLTACRGNAFSRSPPAASSANASAHVMAVLIDGRENFLPISNMPPAYTPLTTDRRPGSRAKPAARRRRPRDGSNRGDRTACGSRLSISPALGEAVAAWISEGEPPFDLSLMSTTRFGPEAQTEAWLRKNAAWQYRHFYGAV